MHTSSPKGILEGSEVSVLKVKIDMYRKCSQFKAEGFVDTQVEVEVVRECYAR